MRFRPEQHLRRQGDIRAVRTEGRKVDCGAFTFWWRESGGDTVPGGGKSRPCARVCFVASTAAVGGAILRNRAKRRLREVFRRNQELVPSGCDFLLVARRPATTWAFAELESKFSQACRKVGPIGRA